MYIKLLTNMTDIVIISKKFYNTCRNAFCGSFRKEMHINL